MAPRTGRPKSENPRTNVVPIRLTADELDILRTAAETMGTTVGEFIRNRALAAAKRIR